MAAATAGLAVTGTLLGVLVGGRAVEVAPVAARGAGCAANLRERSQVLPNSGSAIATQMIENQSQ